MHEITTHAPYNKQIPAKTGAYTVKLRIMVVDDHRIFRQALVETLADDPAIEVVAEAGDGAEALTRAAACQPDVVCMDISMPHMNGIEATRLLLAAQPQIKVIGLSASDEHYLVSDMLAAGAVAYVNKANAGQDLLAKIHTITAKVIGCALPSNPPLQSHNG